MEKNIRVETPFIKKVNGLVPKSIIKVKDDIYFLNKKGNALFRERDGKVEMIYFFQFNTFPVYCFIFSVNNCVWLCPFYGRKISCYDIEKDKLNSYEIPETSRVWYGIPFGNYYLNGNELWLIPESYDCIVGIDLEKMEVFERIEKFEDLFYGFCKKAGGTYFFDFITYKQYFILNESTSSSFVLFNMDTNEYEIVNLPKKMNSNYWVARHENKLIFLSSGKSPQTLWYDLENKCFMKGKELDTGEDEVSIFFFYYVNNEMFICTLSFDHFNVYDSTLTLIRKINIAPVFCKEIYNGFRCSEGIILETREEGIPSLFLQSDKEVTLIYYKEDELDLFLSFIADKMDTNLKIEE